MQIQMNIDMDNNSLVSIIVPLFNAKQYIGRCLDSIINQSYKEIEIIIVDDGSTDGSGQLCDEIQAKDSRVVVVHKKNEGVSKARNAGLEKAKGKYIVFLDVDDLMKNNFIENIYQKNEFPLVVGGYELFGIKSGSEGPEKNMSINVEMELALLWNKKPEYYWWFVWGKLFRRDIIVNNNIRFKSELIYLEDFCFVLEYLSQIDSVCLQDSHDIQHLVESSKYSKYRMDYSHLKRHMQIHEECFTLLEKICNTSFVIMRKKIAYRHFANFWNYLIKSDRPYHEKFCNVEMFLKDDNKPRLFRYVSRRQRVYWMLCKSVYYLNYPFYIYKRRAYCL